MDSFTKALWCITLSGLSLQAQSPQAQAPQVQASNWQQRVDYTMEVSLDTDKHRLAGRQTLLYTNNSPDTLRRVYYHLYFNAFRPGSMMDIRSRTIKDPDPRVGNRIHQLKASQYGSQRITQLTQDGRPLSVREAGTVAVVELAEALLPGARTQLQLRFEAQVPIQIRRSGRNSKENIAYSMSQWYPKLAEYDHRGWHPTPYVGREFHGVWGSFDVRISLPSNYMVAATGLLQNAAAIGKGYAPSPRKKLEKNTTWHFKADRVHDFVWAADTDYVHKTQQVPNGPLLRFFYLPQYDSVWQQMQPLAVKAFQYLNKHFGRYPYAQYCIIQGGDGGMEYPMATLVTGARSLRSLVGVVVHEAAHSWYQGLLATNETLYAWMDEGFTSYADICAEAYAFGEAPTQALKRYYDLYRSQTKSGTEERMNTMADHFELNRNYSVASYIKGAIFQHQLEYVIGRKAFAKGLLRYFEQWRFRHPDPMDYIRVMEQVSGMELDWYYEYFANTTAVIDYGIRSVEQAADNTRTMLTLARIGPMPMPIDLLVTYTDGRKQHYYIPLQIMYGAKNASNSEHPFTRMTVWPWTHPYYRFELGVPMARIASIEIDPSGRLADVDLGNQRYEASKSPKDSSTATPLTTPLSSEEVAITRHGGVYVEKP